MRGRFRDRSRFGITSKSPANMPMNNNQANQKVLSAAVRLARLPIVSSAYAKISVFYMDTKSSHPTLRSVCDVLENGAMAFGTVASQHVSPVFGKLEPQIAVANSVACRSLDWLEASFPVLQTSVDQIAESTRSKVLEIQDVMSILVSGSVDCAKHTVTWAVGSAQLAVNEGQNVANDRQRQSVVVKAINAASVGMKSALGRSEALLDQVLPPSEDVGEEAGVVQGFEASSDTSNNYVRLVSLTNKLCRRACQKVEAKLQHAQPEDKVPWSQELFQYLFHRVLCALFFLCQMSNLHCSSTQNVPESQCQPKITKASIELSVVPYVQTPPYYRIRKPPKLPPVDNTVKDS